MKVTPTRIKDVLIIEPDVHGDDRGFFFESFNRQRFEQATGVNCEFVQDNHSLSAGGVIRGLHYQIRQPQAKLVRVTAGEIFDVVVDLRKSSVTFGQWDSVVLSSDNHKQILIPEGFAHGFLVMSDVAEVVYKTSDYYSPQDERSIIWNDSDLSIAWPLDGAAPILSDKDAAAVSFQAADCFE